MPLDTSIPLQVQAPQFQDYSQLAAQTQANALRNQLTQQEMQQNALRLQYLQEDRARAEANRAASARQTAENRKLLTDAFKAPDPAQYLIGVGRPDLLDEVSKYTKSATELGEAKSKTQTAEDDAQLGLISRGLKLARTPEERRPLYSALRAHPRYGAVWRQIYPDDDSFAAAGEELRVKDPAMFDQTISMTGAQYGELQKNLAKTTATTNVPDLKKGERWNAEEGRVEAVPGSDIYVQQSAKHGKDYGALNDVNTTADMTIKTIDKILDPKNQTGFERNFGGYNAAMVTQYSPDAQDVKADIETLKSQLKVAGLKLIRQGGSIGAMTEKEWPIVQNMLDTITPYMSEEKARDTLKEIQARINAIRDTAKDTYETTWGGSQYYKDTSKKDSKTAVPATTPSGASVSNW